MANWFNNLIDTITGSENASSSAAGNAREIGRPTPKKEDVALKDSPQRLAEKEAVKIATLAGLDAETINHAKAGAAAAVTGMGNSTAVIAQAAQDNVAKAGGFDSRILELALQEGRNARSVGMSTAQGTDHNSVQVGAGAGIQRGGAVIGIA